jgi:polygalacturonase
MIPLISSPGRLDNFVLSGEGTIDGSGEVWWQHVNKPTYFKAGNLLLPRPRLVAITAKNMAVRGITLTNSPTFHLVPTGCESLLIEDIHIIAPEHAPNTDAIDPSGCKNIVIRKCTLDVGDDDVAIKAGGAGPCSDIQITDCTILHGHGISIGSETNASVKNMTVRNCTFDGTTPALRIKSSLGRGGDISGILYDHITMNNVSIAVELNMTYDATPANNPAGGNLVPHLNGATFKDITATNAKQAMKIIGLPQAPIENIHFENVSIAATTGMSIGEAKGITLKNVNVTVKQGEVLATKNADVKRQ